MDILTDIQAWQIWVILGVLLIIAEVIGTEFILFAIGVAFLVTGVMTDAFDFGLNMQLLTAGIASAMFVPLFMRFYRRVFKATGTKSLVSEGVGQDEDLQIVDYAGRLGIRIQGDFYPARTFDDAPLAAGDWVRLVEMKGVTAFVEQI
jgi:membrane protein implicated in regulation of membrane protease activity